MARIIDIDVELPVFMRSGEQLQADWNQNDDTQPDYINNKPAIKAGTRPYSIAEGYNTTASGYASHAEGFNTTASGGHSHAEGNNTTTTTTANFSHVEGWSTTASEIASHAEGDRTTASGQASHAEGSGTKATGHSSHAEGSGTTASGVCSHAEGEYTTAKNRSQHVFGEYNIEDPSSASATSKGTFIEIVGNGANNDNRSNARTLDWSGNETLAGTLRIGSTSTGGALLKFESNSLKVSFDNGATWGTVQITF